MQVDSHSSKVIVLKVRDHTQRHAGNRASNLNSSMLVQVDNDMRDAGGFRLYEVDGTRTNDPEAPVRGRPPTMAREGIDKHAADMRLLVP